MQAAIDGLNADNTKKQGMIVEILQQTDNKVAEATENASRRHENEREELKRRNEQELQRNEVERENDRVRHEEQQQDLQRQAKIAEEKHWQDMDRMRSDRQKLEEKHGVEMTELKEEGGRNIDNATKQLDEEREQHDEDNRKHNAALMNHLVESQSTQKELTDTFSQELRSHVKNRLEMAKNYENRITNINTERALTNGAYSNALITQSGMDRFDKQIDAVIKARSTFGKVSRDELQKEILRVAAGLTASPANNSAMRKMKNATEVLRTALENVSDALRNTGNDDRTEEKGAFKDDLNTVTDYLAKFIDKRNDFEISMLTKTSAVGSIQSWIFGKKSASPKETAEILKDSAEELIRVLERMRLPPKGNAIREVFRKDRAMIEASMSTPREILSASSVVQAIEHNSSNSEDAVHPPSHE